MSGFIGHSSVRVTSSESAVERSLSLRASVPGCVCSGYRRCLLPAAGSQHPAKRERRGGWAPVTSAPEPQLHFADERVPAVLHPKRAKKKKNEINKYIHKKPRTMQGSSH